MTHAILIVDDSADDAAVLENALREIGFLNAGHHVSSAVEAVAYMRGDLRYADRAVYPEPEVVFLDLKMPGMDGFDFLEWLQLNGKLHDMKVIVVSGLGDLDSIRRAYLMGATSFVSKPFTLADLKNVMDSVVGLARAQIH